MCLFARGPKPPASRMRKRRRNPPDPPAFSVARALRRRALCRVQRDAVVVPRLRLRLLWPLLRWRLRLRVLLLPVVVRTSSTGEAWSMLCSPAACTAGAIEKIAADAVAGAREAKPRPAKPANTSLRMV